MADGLNEPRALRVTEVLRDYQAIQTKIAAYQADPKPDDFNETGYSTLRQCHSEAWTLLNAPFPSEMLHPPSGADDAVKRQLQRVILDASVRRFKAQKIYLRATAAVKWINARNSILKNGKPKNGDQAKIQQVENTFRQIQELNNVTDQRIVNYFSTRDQQAGFWLNDDPSLSAIHEWIRSHG